MNELSISLPTDLLEFAEKQATANGLLTAEDYICSLITKDVERVRLREMLTQGLGEPAAVKADAGYFKALRAALRP